MSADAARLSSVGVVASTPAARELAHGQSTREASSSVHRRGFRRQQNHRLVLTRLVSRVAGAHCISGHHCILHCSSYCRTSENVLLTENGVNVGKRSEALRYTRLSAISFCFICRVIHEYGPGRARHNGRGEERYLWKGFTARRPMSIRIYDFNVICRCSYTCRHIGPRPD